MGRWRRVFNICPCRTAYGKYRVNRRVGACQYDHSAWSLTALPSILFRLHEIMILKAGTHYPHVTWAHIKLTFYFQLLPYPFPCVGSHILISVKRSVGALFQLAFSPFLETTGNVWRALDTYATSHEMCATAEIWEECWHVSRPELHARSRDVNRVTEVWICAVEFNVKSPLTS